MGGREQCLHARSKVRVPDIHPSGHTMKVAWRPTLARAIILVLLVVARVPASWHMRHLGHTDDVGRVNADKVKSGVVDDFSEIECPKDALLPASELVVVVCCATPGKKVHQLRTDHALATEADWTESLRYCRVTLRKVQNKGLESTAFLHYLATRYDDLPARVVMVHGNNGWHDHVSKGTLLAPNFTRWLPQIDGKHGFIPFPAPLTHDGDIDTRDAKTISMQRFYDTQLQPILGLPPQRISDPGQDRLHYCCAQFVLTRETIHRNSRQAYARLRDYVYSEDADYRTSRELEHGWPIIFTGTMRASPSLIGVVEDWRRNALLAPCEPWGCTCQGLSDAFGSSPGNQARATSAAWNWYNTGAYDSFSSHQVSVLSHLSASRAGAYTMEGRRADGSCTTHPQHDGDGL